MTILALLTKFGPWLLGILGVVAAAFTHQQKKAAQAEADTAKQKAAAADAQAASARADAIAAKTALNTVQTASEQRANVDAQVAQIATSDDLDKALKDEGFTR